MIERFELCNYLDNFLACADFNDYAPNGLQIEGRQHINKICTAVTASAEAIGQAIAHKADALLVHHGYFWRAEEAVLTGMKRQRIAALLEKDINLFAYHLPLDCHPELGNNACLAKLLETDSLKRHPAGKVKDLLFSGQLSKPMNPKDFCHFLADKFERKPLHISAGDKPIHRIAWCSGAAQDFIEDAAKLGVDAYISGEISERTYYQAKESSIHYFACGHHATERYGIQALGNHLAGHYDLEHYFIDSDNPI